MRAVVLVENRQDIGELIYLLNQILAQTNYNRCVVEVSSADEVVAVYGDDGKVLKHIQRAS